MFSRDRKGPPRALPLLLGYDEDVVEQEEVAEPAGTAAEDASLFRQQQVQLPPLQQPAGSRDQWEWLKRTQEQSELRPGSQEQSTPSPAAVSELAADRGSVGMDTSHAFRCPLQEAGGEAEQPCTPQGTRSRLYYSTSGSCPHLTVLTEFRFHCSCAGDESSTESGGL